jgi:hypothetical protein
VPLIGSHITVAYTGNSKFRLDLWRPTGQHAQTSNPDREPESSQNTPPISIPHVEVIAAPIMDATHAVSVAV